MQKIVDFIVVGSGIAGLHAAQTLAEYGEVLMLTKAAIRDSATYYAQGGIAAAIGENDSVDAHIDDTLRAGSYHNTKEAVSFLVQQGAAAIEELVTLGVPFDKKPDGTFATSFEAAHSYPRIFHATDFTGQAIEEALVSSVLSNNHIEVWEDTCATDLIVNDTHCFGVYAVGKKPGSLSHSIFARATILASGGAGQVYERTVTPSVATGDGIAMAHRAGIELTDLEFIQFHPTALKEQGKKKGEALFLLSEALRGEGAILVDNNGKRFMQDIHPEGDLAPRDVVARTIFQKQKKGEVYLDIRHKGKKFIINRFPNMYSALQKRGFDLTTDRIPVTPAAHFICGGIVTDLYGRTSMKQLFAYGEVAATGVHGANRLASNSLLEGFVFSRRIKECIAALPARAQVLSVTEKAQEKFQEKYDMQKHLKEIMWEYVGIERSEKKLAFAIKEIIAMHEEIQEAPVTETKNMVQVALLIAEAAYRRKKSLGSHYIIDG